MSQQFADLVATLGVRQNDFRLAAKAGMLAIQASGYNSQDTVDAITHTIRTASNLDEAVDDLLEYINGDGIHVVPGSFDAVYPGGKVVKY